MSDLWQDPEVVAWIDHFRNDVVPKITSSRFGISICPPKGEFDVKFASELGAMIMLGKPIILVAHTNDDIPPKLRQIADKIVIGQVGEEGFQERLMSVIGEMA